VIIFLGVIFGFLAFCMVALILLQESKGGGIAAMGVPGMDNIMGARNPLRRLTVVFAILMLLIIFGINVVIQRQTRATIPEGLEIEEPEDEADTAAGEQTGAGEEAAETPLEAVPAAPADTPAEGPAAPAESDAGPAEAPAELDADEADGTPEADADAPAADADEAPPAGEEEPAAEGEAAEDAAP
jgi:protein translocase SecG subunit